MKVLIIGSGGREHALAWKIKQSSLVSEVFCAPGNGGTSDVGTNVAVKADDIDGLLAFARDNKVDLTVVGPEQPLVAGVVDAFEKAGLKVFGPSQQAAELEGSKIFSKELMAECGVPTAAFGVFEDAEAARAYIRQRGAPIVVKADGLAAGKGVIVAATEEEALAAVDAMMERMEFGNAGRRILIEDCLRGEEASIIAVVDKNTVLPLVVSQDHKRIYDNDQGPNTGGMGAYAPAPLVNPTLQERITREVFQPLLKGLQRRGIVFRGILYAGLMIDGETINVLEFNVRFGDPETQVILPKLKTDLVELFQAACDDRLNTVRLEWDERFCITVVLAAGGYPGSYEKGTPISGLEAADVVPDVKVFHAGTDYRDGRYVTAGGRVLNVSALGTTFDEARSNAYEAIKKIHFDGMQYRKDIGAKARKYM